jgi:dTDP-glucose 4,6-dehydratase
MRTFDSLLITGGCGFIGSALIRYLFGDGGFTGKLVNRAVDEQRYTFVRGDICNSHLVAQLCDEHEVDGIVHLAAESHVDRSIQGPGAFVQTNIVGTYELLEVVRAHRKIHFHHVSTDEVYGSLGDTGLFHETTAYDPSSPYSASKAASDHLVRAYARTYGVSTTLSNCSNNYGPFQFPEKLLPLMILNMREGKPLPVYGDGSNVRDWLHVDDHSEALWTIMRRGKLGETYNIGGEAERQNLALLHELIEVVAELTGKSAGALRDSITFVKDRPGHDQRYAIDCSKLKSELDWTQRHDLTAGLRDTVRWYLDNGEWIERAKSGAYRDWIEGNYDAR